MAEVWKATEAPLPESLLDMINIRPHFRATESGPIFYQDPQETCTHTQAWETQVQSFVPDLSIYPWKIWSTTQSPVPDPKCMSSYHLTFWGTTHMYSFQTFFSRCSTSTSNSVHSKLTHCFQFLMFCWGTSTFIPKYPTPNVKKPSFLALIHNVLDVSIFKNIFFHLQQPAIICIRMLSSVTS